MGSAAKGSPAHTWHEGSPTNLQLLASGEICFVRGKAHPGGKGGGSAGPGGAGGLLTPVPTRGHAGGRPGLGGLWRRPAGGTRREAAAPPGTFLLSSSRGWKIYKARSENIYTAAILGGIWDVNLKNLWGEDHNGPFERASVAIAASRPRRRGAPPAAAPALMGASPAGSPPGSQGGCARRPRRRPAPLIASRASPCPGRAAPRGRGVRAVSCGGAAGPERHGGDPRLQPRAVLILSKSNIPRRAGPQPGKFQPER